MIALLARLVLGGLVKVGVSEGSAGAFVASRIFAPLILLALGALLVPAGKLFFYVHDMRVATTAANQARLVCITEIAAKAEKAKAAATERALARNQELLFQRTAALTSIETELQHMKGENDVSRSKAPGLGALVLEPDDPWWLRKPQR